MSNCTTSTKLACPTADGIRFSWIPRQVQFGTVYNINGIYAEEVYNISRERFGLLYRIFHQQLSFVVCYVQTRIAGDSATGPCRSMTVSLSPSERVDS
jgi:hypothetical protein